MKKTVYMHMPANTFGLWRVVNTFNDISERFVGSKVLFDTPEESMEANRKSAPTMPLACNRNTRRRRQMTATRYFVAGDPKSHDIIMELGNGSYEECFFAVVDDRLPCVLMKSIEVCKAWHLKHGMTPEFFEQTARFFRVTVEEVTNEVPKTAGDM